MVEYVKTRTGPGLVVFEDIPVGNYICMVETTGYVTESQVVQVLENQTKTYEVMMMEGPVEERYEFGELDLTPPVGSYKTASVNIPSLAGMLSPYLEITVFDIDCEDEGDVYINDVKVLDIPVTGDGITKTFTSPFSISYLKEGMNEIKAVFASDCGGTTRYYRIVKGAIIIKPEEVVPTLTLPCPSCGKQLIIKLELRGD